MSSVPIGTAQPPPRTSPGARLAGLDLARALALLAMIATHTLPLYDSAPGAYGPEVFAPTPTGWVFAGRSSVLFAVLAGAALVLMRGRSLVYLFTRSAVLVLIGVLLEFLGTPVLIILGPLAVAMAVTAPFRRCSAGLLVPLALSWLLVAPWLNRWLNLQLAEHSGPFWSTWAALRDVLPVAWHAYPIPIWIGYSMLGAAVIALFIQQPSATARAGSELRQRTGLLWLLLGGAGAAAAAAWLAGSRTVEALAAAPGWSARASSIVETGLWVGNFVPQPLAVAHLWELEQFQWLPTPHSGAALAVWQHAACAVLVICAALLLTRWRPRWAAAPPLSILCGIGRWSLTNYVLHLLVLAAIAPYVDSDAVSALIVFAAVLAAGMIAALSGERGPLERLLGLIGGGVENGLARLRGRPAEQSRGRSR